MLVISWSRKTHKFHNVNAFYKQSPSSQSTRKEYYFDVPLFFMQQECVEKLLKIYKANASGTSPDNLLLLYEDTIK